MTIVDMLVQSSLLTVLGMGIVFSFLIVLIIFINLTTKIIKMLGLDKDVSNATSELLLLPHRIIMLLWLLLLLLLAKKKLNNLEF